MTYWHDPTEAEVAKMISAAYDHGLQQWRYCPTDRTVDWDDWDTLLREFEVGGIDLGTDDDSPLIRKIRAAYRRGLKHSLTD